MTLLRFLKDCMWSIENKAVPFAKDEEKEIEDDLAKEMVEAKYAVYANQDVPESQEVPNNQDDQGQDQEDVSDKSLTDEDLENKIQKRGRPRKNPEE